MGFSMAPVGTSPVKGFEVLPGVVPFVIQENWSDGSCYEGSSVLHSKDRSENGSCRYSAERHTGVVQGREEQAYSRF